MLAAGKVVGFIQTKDPQKASAVYEGKLGFQFVNDDQFALLVRALVVRALVVRALVVRADGIRSESQRSRISLPPHTPSWDGTCTISRQYQLAHEAWSDIRKISVGSGS